MSTVKNLPYELEWNTGVYAKVQAINAYGASGVSPEGNGAIITTVPDPPVNLSNVPELTTATQIGLVWEDGAFDGGKPVLDYKLYWDRGEGLAYPVYEVLQQGITSQSYIATGLTTGLVYSFKLQAHNEEGYSSFSSAVQILAAQVPDAPDMPTTQVVGDQLVIAWNEVNANGSPITSYYILLRSHTGTYHTELEYCDGSDPTIVDTRTCTIPLSTFYSSPFDMVLGDHIYAKITAINLYGDSLESVPGDGAAVVFLPEAPLNLANNAAETTDVQISLLWEPGISDGGRPVLDFRIWYD